MGQGGAVSHGRRGRQTAARAAHAARGRSAAREATLGCLCVYRHCAAHHTGHHRVDSVFCACRPLSPLSSASRLCLESRLSSVCLGGRVGRRTVSPVTDGRTRNGRGAQSCGHTFDTRYPDIPVRGTVCRRRSRRPSRGRAYSVCPCPVAPVPLMHPCACPCRLCPFSPCHSSLPPVPARDAAVGQCCKLTSLPLAPSRPAWRPGHVLPCTQYSFPLSLSLSHRFLYPLPLGPLSLLALALQLCTSHAGVSRRPPPIAASLCLLTPLLRSASHSCLS